MQTSLFQGEDEMKNYYKKLIIEVKATGRLAKFLHCRLRKYYMDTNQAPTDVLIHLEAMQRLAEGICATSMWISSPRALKTSDFSFIYVSQVPDIQLRLESDAEKCWNSFFDLKTSVSQLCGRFLTKTEKMDHGLSYAQHVKISDLMVNLVFKVGLLGLSMRTTIPYDIQSR